MFSEWANERPVSWAARWFGTDGKRRSKSFPTRKEAERFAETKQQAVRQGNGDPPQRMTKAVRVQDELQVPVHLGAEEAVGERVVGISRDANRAPILDRDEHGARVGTVMRTGAAHHGCAGLGHSGRSHGGESIGEWRTRYRTPDPGATHEPLVCRTLP